MTVAINYLSENIAITATDTRISLGKNQEYGYSDDNEKLFNLSYMGWCAGTGLVQFLDPFKSRLSKAKIYHTDEIEKIFKDVISEAKNKYPEFNKFIDESATVFSWIGIPNGYNHKCCRLGVLQNNQFGTELQRILFDNIYILYPYEYCENSELLNDFTGRYNFNYQFDGNIEIIISKILIMFKELSLNAQSVSNICDIGILLRESDMVYKIRIKDNIEELLLAIQSNNLLSKVIHLEEWT